jgi:hypothetical protein
MSAKQDLALFGEWCSIMEHNEKGRPNFQVGLAQFKTPEETV